LVLSKIILASPLCISYPGDITREESTMNRQYEDTICIDTIEGVMECPAVFGVCNDYASLIRFTIGNKVLTTDDAIAMTGTDHVSTQELQVWAKWIEETNDDGIGE
jgi:hypothetical protein